MHRHSASLQPQTVPCELEQGQAVHMYVCAAAMLKHAHAWLNSRLESEATSSPPNATRVMASSNWRIVLQFAASSVSKPMSRRRNKGMCLQHCQT